MKRAILLIIAVISTFSAYCQSHLQEGDRCFYSGDYTCAEKKYNEAYKSASGKDKQVIEIKLTRAKWCAEHLKNADQAFSNKNYIKAKESYQKVLDSNPKDTYTKAQIDKISSLSTQKPLRKATVAELTDIWNNKYGIMPARRQNLIDAGIDPDDAQKRINNGEGKPITTTITLNVSKQNISFRSNSESTIINVRTNAKDYEITNLPFWCKIKSKNASSFSLACEANTTNRFRSDWFNVIAGGNEVRITVNQAASTPTQSQTQITNLNVSKESLYFRTKGGTSEKISIYSNARNYSVGLVPSWCKVQTFDGYIVVVCGPNISNKYRQDYLTIISGDKIKRIYVTQGGKNDSFNYPQTDYSWGISVGYLEDNLGYSSKGLQIGIRFEPQFKYGFGLNTGFLYEYSSSNLFKDSYYDYEEHALNIPLHLEYRLNFSRWFNVFAYGGAGINVVTNSSFDNYSFPVTLDYGAGFRIDRVQFNVGKSLYLGDFNHINSFGDDIRIYRKLLFSVSYMFK